jgi:hypothetical protein
MPSNGSIRINNVATAATITISRNATQIAGPLWKTLREDDIAAVLRPTTPLPTAPTDRTDAPALKRTVRPLAGSFDERTRAWATPSPVQPLNIRTEPCEAAKRTPGWRTSEREGAPPADLLRACRIRSPTSSLRRFWPPVLSVHDCYATHLSLRIPDREEAKDPLRDSAVRSRGRRVVRWRNLDERVTSCSRTKPVSPVIDTKGPRARASKAMQTQNCSVTGRL